MSNGKRKGLGQQIRQRPHAPRPVESEAGDGTSISANRAACEEALKEGVKHDGGKLDYSLVQPGAHAEMVAVLTYGATKYARDNWMLVPEAEQRYYAAALRHLEQWRTSATTDDESGLHHLAHAMCCLHFLLALEVPAFRTEAHAAAMETARKLRAKKGF